MTDESSPQNIRIILIQRILVSIFFKRSDGRLNPIFGGLCFAIQP